MVQNCAPIIFACIIAGANRSPEEGQVLNKIANYWILNSHAGGLIVYFGGPSKFISNLPLDLLISPLGNCHTVEAG